MSQFTEQDLIQMQGKGISSEKVSGQIERFKEGFPYLKLNRAATPGFGVRVLNSKEIREAITTWNTYQESGAKIQKFVPASGAASRMFKDLFAFVGSGRTMPETDFEKKFFEEITHFAFYKTLNESCKRQYGNDIKGLCEAGRQVDVVKSLLLAEGMNYGALPKALLEFHKTATHKTHTPLEEHLEEGAQYAADAQRRVDLHFTVSGEHKAAFKAMLKEKLPLLEQVWGVSYKVSMSEQKSSTDTIAVTTSNEPYRDDDGRLLFRPAGHGALLENLNEQDADVIFIKNIDNVVPMSLRHETIRYKKVLGGVLVKVQKTISEYLRLLSDKKASVSEKELQEILEFVERELCVSNEGTATMDADALKAYLVKKLNRPIRVCGVVKNEGEPGGGPYLAYDSDGSCSPQILEAAQIDPNDEKAVEMMKNGTHFNPVDLVCYIKDFKGKKFDLKKFVDQETGLISMKSKNGVDIKALELPGLWNGSMSDWNTLFVEVPIETFNPVKTVNDLLRKEHQ